MDAARKVASGELDLAELAGLEDAALLERLLSIHGVGRKVALCTMLYGFNRLDSFPIDVWMERLLAERYPSGFPYGRYRGHSGILQLWLFHAIRNT
jgi:N-glycosylase/DNA lyase